MTKVDPWVWFWPALILLNVYGCQQEHVAHINAGTKSTAYEVGEKTGEKIREGINSIDDYIDNKGETDCATSYDEGEPATAIKKGPC